jgi:signal transduction histidine kinase
MSIQRGDEGRLTVALLRLAPAELIPYCRLALAISAWALAWAEAPLPATGVLVYALAGPACLSMIRSVATRRLALHLADMLMLVSLMHVFEGNVAAQLLFFVAALLFASLRGTWIGVGQTALTVAALYAVGSLLRAGYLMAPGAQAETLLFVGSAALIIFLTALRDHARWQIAALASWPPPEEPEAEYSFLRPALAHALSILNARGAAVVWQEKDEPYQFLVWFDQNGLRSERRPPPSNPAALETTANRQLVAPTPNSGVIEFVSRPQCQVNAPIDPALLADLSAERIIISPWKSEHASGHFLLLDPEDIDRTTPAFGAIVADHIASEVEHYVLQNKLAETRAIQERMRINRDLHDGALQVLTALDLQLQGVLRDAPGTLKPRITKLRELVGQQHRELRGLLAFSGTPRPNSVFLTREIESALHSIEQLWGCDAVCKVQPLDLEVTLETGAHIRFLIKEAGANAVRHGRASRIVAEASAVGGLLTLEFRDNGTGATTGDRHVFGDLLACATAPRSLTSRVKELGGSIRLSSTGEWFVVTITLPLFGRD